MQLTTTSQRGFAPATLTEAITFSEMLSNSNMVPKAYQNKPQDILVCVQWGMEMGLAPMQALQNIAVINGKPSVYGDAMMALVQASAVCDDVEEYFENEGTPNPVAVCVAKRKNRKPVVAKFSVEDAKRAGLWGKQGPWSAYPKRMMQMRARGFALRDAFPDVLKGLISAEEAQDYPDEAKPRPAKDITPRNPLDMVAKPAPVAIPAMTSDPQVIAEAMADTVDEEPTVVQPEVVEVMEPVDEVAQSAVQHDGVQPIGYALLVPGKDDPFSVHQDLDEWANAYEDLADKTARAGKRPARERMTALKELRMANEDTIQRIDSVKRIRHTASYSQRIKALGAAIAD
jgi:hypothetical protein